MRTLYSQIFAFLLIVAGNTSTGRTNRGEKKSRGTVITPGASFLQAGLKDYQNGMPENSSRQERPTASKTLLPRHLGLRRSTRQNKKSHLNQEMIDLLDSDSDVEECDGVPSHIVSNACQLYAWI